MTEEEAIERIKWYFEEDDGVSAEDITKEAVYMLIIDALKQPSDEMQLLNDGTLKVKVANVSDIKRVMVMDDNVIYDSYYPDRPKGEWILECDGRNECDNLYKCSVCGVECGCEEYDKPNFCPNCGADMRSKR